ncbi:NUDIX domain-containing protein [Massilia niabensis]|uniref:NUDIX domain-containing protein n=1 Tax=Massilia niabensis TaxID=544910 RepID=A0ABW0L2Q7_9BURK
MASKPLASGRQPREVVAALLTHGGAVGLFRRSACVSGDAGCWHCITGFLPPGGDALVQALAEIDEEAGIASTQLQLRQRRVLALAGKDGSTWLVHAFHFESATDTVMLNWEHDACCWLAPGEFAGLVTVSWLAQVCAAVLPAAHARHVVNEMTTTTTETT